VCDIQGRTVGYTLLVDGATNMAGTSQVFTSVWRSQVETKETVAHVLGPLGVSQFSVGTGGQPRLLVVLLG